MKKLFFTFLFALSLAVLQFTAFAGTNQLLKANVSLPSEYHPDYAPVINIQGGNEASYGNYFMQLLAGGLIYLAAPAAVLTIAVGGLRYVISHGEQEEMDAAKKTITYAVIGLIVIILSYAIVKAIIGAILQI